MNHSVYDLTAVQFGRSLEALKGILLKAREHAKARNFDENGYLTMKTAPDMFPLVRQIQIATDTAKGAMGRLTGKQVPAFSDDEKTLGDLIARVDRTIALLKEFTDKDFASYSSQKITMPWHPGKYMMGDDYLVSHAMPNFFFHMTMAYSLFRASGVPIGKADFLGNQKWQAL